MNDKHNMCSRQHIIRRVITIGLMTLIVIMICLTLLPAGVYWYGLSLIDGKPLLPHTHLQNDHAMSIWRQYQGEGTPRIQPLTPWHYYLIFYTSVSPDSFQYIHKNYPGFNHANTIAQRYVITQPRLHNLQWHISTAALGIWITRHWTINQILAKLSEQHQE